MHKCFHCRFSYKNKDIMKDVANKIKKLRQKKIRNGGVEQIGLKNGNSLQKWMDSCLKNIAGVNPPSVTDTMAERQTQNTVQTKQSSDRILTAYLSLVLFSRKLVYHMC